MQKLFITCAGSIGVKMIQRKPMKTCKLVNLWLGGKLGCTHCAENKPTTEPNLNAHHVRNMYLRNIRSRHHQIAIVSNTSATAETLGKTAGAYIQTGKVGIMNRDQIFITVTEEMVLSGTKR